MEVTFDIPLYGSSLEIVRRCGKALSDVLNCKFGCVATFDGVDFKSHPSISQQKTVVPEKRFSVTLKTGVKVSVWRGDLTSFPVESVVNAANIHLNHCGGLALALSRAGGPQIQQESDIYIRKHGVLKTGEAIVADAGLLPYKKIIHAVGPELDTNFPDVQKAEPLLKKSIWSILDQVKENHLRTVAIPAISSGLFHYPLPQCAATIVSAVKSYYEKNSFHNFPDEIFLVNNDEPTVQEMERACRQKLQPSMVMTYSQATGSSNSKSAASASTVKIGNVLLTLKRGRIEEQQTNVIVNTTMSYNSLDSGEISKAILAKAGREMQREIRIFPTSQHVIVTKGYKLRCDEVFHTCCCEKGQDTKQEVLLKTVHECLWTAVSRGHKSIAFPAIGSGGLKMNKKEVALTMSEAVADFASKAPKMMEVNFVIFPSDTETYEAFEKQMRSLQQNVSNPHFTHAPVYRDDIKPQSPQISLNGPSNEALHEAQQWLKKLFKPSLSVCISNNFIQHFGEKEYMQLTRLTNNAVSIEESFEKGHARISVNGYTSEDVVVAAMQVEAMLCCIQSTFVLEEENDMSLKSHQKVLCERKTANHTGPLFSDLSSAFKAQGLQVLKLEKVENPALETLFDLKKEQLKCLTTRTMLQRIPAQFCEMVGRIGFHAECAPPEEPKYGDGIYFAKTVTEAMELWNERNEEFLYFVQAEVLTGNSTYGKQGLILPPADPNTVYDSVHGGHDISVIFSTYQALPKHIITCKMI